MGEEENMIKIYSMKKLNKRSVSTYIDKHCLYIFNKFLGLFYCLCTNVLPHVHLCVCCMNPGTGVMDG